MDVDYIIIGQGISGTLLSYNLLQAGKRVIVVDEQQPDTASYVASGVINPITGRRVVRTWMIEELLPFAWKIYEDIGTDLGIEIVSQADIISFHASEQMSNAWRERIQEGEEYLQNIHNQHIYEQYFEVRNGIGLTTPCLLVNLHDFLQIWRERLSEKGYLLTECFDEEQCIISNGQVSYRHIKAEKVIFCNGINGYSNPYFSKLPHALSKGEALIVSIPGLPRTNIYKQGINIVPFQNDTFWVGSSFEWDFEHKHPTQAFRDKTETALKDWLKLPITVLDHISAVRPASLDRRPFVGLHPVHPEVGILNGMGTKGCSLAPYFAHQFTQHLISGQSIHPAASLSRFTKILS